MKEVYNEIEKGNYKKVITTGIQLPDYYPLTQNGYLIFYPEIKKSDFLSEKKHIIELDAFSEVGGSNKSHYRLFINNSVVNEGYLNKKINKYKTEWIGDLTAVDSVMLQFDNDLVGRFGDRNMWVKEIIIDDTIRLTFKNSIYDRFELDGKDVDINNFETFAGAAKERLIKYGVDPDKIVSVPAENVRLFRTLHSALEFKKWMNKSNEQIKSVNIISQGVHSKRTYKIYNSILGKSINIGIISIPETKSKQKIFTRYKKIVKEIVASAIYSVALLFF